MNQYWQNDLSCIEERTTLAFEKEYLMDVTFAVRKDSKDEPKILRAHKLILAFASSAFEAMFYGPLAYKSGDTIEVEGIDPTAFSMMLKYIYSNKLELKCWDEAVELYCTAKKYLFSRLLKYCVDYMREGLDANNVLQMYEFAKFHEENSLLETALNVIKTNTLSVLNSTDFPEIDVSTIITILEQNELNAPEIDLFNALETLATAKNVLDEKIRQVNIEESSGNMVNVSRTCQQFREAVKKIKFLGMSAQEFSCKPAESCLLFPEESLAILRCLAQPEKNIYLYPKGFDRGTRKSFLYFEVSYNGKYYGKIAFELKETPQMVERLYIFRESSQFISFSKSSGQAFKMVGESFVLHKRSSTSHFTYKVGGFDFNIGSAILFAASESGFGRVIEGMEIVNDLYTAASSEYRCQDLLSIENRHCKGYRFYIP